MHYSLYSLYSLACKFTHMEDNEASETNKHVSVRADPVAHCLCFQHSEVPFRPCEVCEESWHLPTQQQNNNIATDTNNTSSSGAQSLFPAQWGSLSSMWSLWRVLTHQQNNNIAQYTQSLVPAQWGSLSSMWSLWRVLTPTNRTTILHNIHSLLVPTQNTALPTQQQNNNIAQYTQSPGSNTEYSTTNRTTISHNIHSLLVPTQNTALPTQQQNNNIAQYTQSPGSNTEYSAMNLALFYCHCPWQSQLLKPCAITAVTFPYVILHSPPFLFKFISDKPFF
jgi:hypothetical protein